MIIKLKEELSYTLIDFATHRQEIEFMLPIGSVLNAVFVDDEFIDSLDEGSKDFYKSIKGYYYADCVENNICDYKDWYLLDHELDRFAFGKDAIELVES